MSDEKKMRLDKWLWVARFFKTRRLAAEAVVGGKVHHGGARAKPGRKVSIGDLLTVSRGEFETEVFVSGFAKQRRPAKEAVLLYEESQGSREKRERQLEMRRNESSEGSYQKVRPNKKQRRQITQIKQRY